jgi:hypothetical protein
MTTWGASAREEGGFAVELWEQTAEPQIDKLIEREGTGAA